MSIATEVRYLDNARDWVIFDGKPLTDFKVYCSGDKTFSAPQRNVDSITIPGRNGTLERDKGTFANITVEYSCWIPSNFRQNIEGLRNYLLSKAGFKRLEDTYDPDTYRLASFHGPLDVSAYYRSTFGSFTLQFTARPERFLKSGETAIVFDSTHKEITNPTLFESKPLIHISNMNLLPLRILNETTEQSMEISNTISNNDSVDEIYIDTESLNAYGYDYNLNMINCNDRIVNVSDKEKWFTLYPGKNEVSLDSLETISGVELIPRWWIL